MILNFQLHFSFTILCDLVIYFLFYPKFYFMVYLKLDIKI